VRGDPISYPTITTSNELLEQRYWSHNLMTYILPSRLFFYLQPQSKIDAMMPTMEESNNYHDLVTDQIEVMMQQETKLYSCRDYCKMHGWGPKEARSFANDRKLMLQWSYNVIDFFNLERETAGIALCYSDRFLQNETRGREFLDDTEKYQLLCIASLYTAIKIHEPASITPKAFAEISRDQYTAEELEETEQLLLDTLDWRVNPPTSLEFVRNYLELLPVGLLDEETKATAYILARAQTERALGEYSFVTVEASKIAFSCVQNALEVLGFGDNNALYCLAAKMDRDYLYFDQEDLRRQLHSVITWETSTIEAVSGHTKGSPYGSNLHDTTERHHLHQNTTPRSVACMFFSR